MEAGSGNQYEELTLNKLKELSLDGGHSHVVIQLRLVASGGVEFDAIDNFRVVVFDMLECNAP